MKSFKQNRFGRIIKSNITALTFKETIEVIEEWIINNRRNYVCICNTHSLVTASNDKLFEKALINASICTPDGMPLVWALRQYGYHGQDRVDGPNLMLKLCELSSEKGYRIFLYGGTNETLKDLKYNLKKQYEHIDIVGSYSPPFRKLEPYEENEIIDMINSTDANLIFVSLGCPKQEIWMFNHQKKINGIMLGVGAAFEFINGTIIRPPLIFQRLGLEWFFRLISEPKRLWKRYAYNNPIYIYKFIKTYKKNKQYTININNLD